MVIPYIDYPKNNHSGSKSQVEPLKICATSLLSPKRPKPSVAGMFTWEKYDFRVVDKSMAFRVDFDH